MTNTSQLRSAIARYVKQNPGNAVKAIKISGIQLTPQEEKSLQTGSLEGFSDQQLTERFTTKTLRVLGIDLVAQSYDKQTQGNTHGNTQVQTQRQDKRSRNS